MPIACGMHTLGTPTLLTPNCQGSFRLSKPYLVPTRLIYQAQVKSRLPPFTAQVTGPLLVWARRFASKETN